MVVSFAIGLGWNRLVKGDTWKYVLGALIAHPRTRVYLWRGMVWGSPYAWIVAKDIGYVAGQTGAAIGRTRTAAAVARVGGPVIAGYVIGAAVGTGIVYVAEEKEIVYEGATEDVIDFYTGRGEYWGDYDIVGRPTTDDPGRPGYFNVPGNLGIIADHVKHGHYFGH